MSTQLAPERNLANSHYGTLWDSPDDESFVAQLVLAGNDNHGQGVHKDM
jgi:hypothetical protein